MSLIHELPAELVYQIGDHMIATTCHHTLCIFSQSCTFLHVNLDDLVVEAQEISLLEAYRTDYKYTLEHVNEEQIAILERHHVLNVPFPSEVSFIDTCVEVCNMDVLKYIAIARKYEEDGLLLPTFFSSCFKGRLEVAQWVTQNVGFMAEEACAMNRWHALGFSCAMGHLMDGKE